MGSLLRHLSAVRLCRKEGLPTYSLAQTTLRGSASRKQIVALSRTAPGTRHEHVGSPSFTPSVQ